MESLYASGVSGGRSKTTPADYEDEMLTDYWVSNNLRRTHERKVMKRVQRLGPLSKDGKPIQVSQSLSSLPGRIGPSPIKINRELEQSASELDLDTSSIEPYRVNELMSRVTFSGQDAAQDADNEGPSMEELATRGREIQYGSMKDSVVMNQIMREVLALHGTMEDITKELSNRKDLGARVDLANQTYVRLFERMLAEVLQMQRSKFQSTAKTLLSLKQELAAAKSKEASGRDKVFAANNVAANAEMAAAGLRSDLTQAQNEIEKLNELVREIEDEKRSMQTTIEVNGRGISEREVKRMLREARNDEVAKAIKQQNDLRKKWLREAELKVQEAMKANSLTSLSISELAERANKVNDFKRPKIDSSSQTEVDEMGVWDKQDGWSLPISGTLVARRRWREAIRFAKCPKCKGNGDFIALCARLLRAMLRGVPVNDDEKPKGKTGAIWCIPDDLVRFMSNLPRSVMAICPRPMPWLLRRVWCLCNSKKGTDDMDEKLGYALQSTPEFLIEHYLRLMPVRSDAEFALYELLTTLQEYYKAHPLLHIFARFVGILDGLSVEEMLARQKELAAEKQHKLERLQREKMQGLGARQKAVLLDQAKERKKDADERQTGKAEPEEKLKMCDSSLTIAIFQIYHYARACLFESYSGVYAGRIASIKQSAAILSEYERKVDKEADWQVDIPAHVCLDSKLLFYVPFDRSVRVLSVLLSFLDESQYQAALRSLESAAVFLNPDGSLYLLDGMHTYVRTTMREFLTTESLDGSDLSWMQIYEQLLAAGKVPPRDEEELGPITPEELERDKYVVMVNLDVALRIVCECMLQRTKYVEKRLADIFVQGDENGDGVLSFIEFTTIVSVVAPHFNERRIIRMFREALMVGNDDDSISPQAFVLTCKKHNLVQLIDVSELRTGLLKAISLSEEQKRARAFALAEEVAKREANLAFLRSAFQTPSQRRASVLQQNSSLSRKGSVSIASSPSNISGRRNSSISTNSLARSMTGGIALLKNRIQSSLSSPTVNGGSSVLPSHNESEADRPIEEACAIDASALDAANSDSVIDGGTAGSPTQLALVEQYAQSANTINPSPISSESARQSPGSSRSDRSSSGPLTHQQVHTEAEALKSQVSQFMSRVASSPVDLESMDRGRLAAALEVAEGNEDSSGDEQETESNAAPHVSGGTQIYPSAHAHTSISKEFAPQLVSSIPPPQAAAVHRENQMPTFVGVPRDPRLKANVPMSKLTAAQMKEQLRLRRENRLNTRSSNDSALLGINDSDDDNSN